MISIMPRCKSDSVVNIAHFIEISRTGATEAALLHRAGFHGLLNLIGEPVEMCVQSVEHFTFGLICGKVAN
jgi:hypothetical protein